ncbi:MAG: peptidylprolyl isomerase [Prevotellaceae bacterium]|nr:peptidylprolyl isomerase [Prevotellaceae bacterium]
MKKILLFLALTIVVSASAKKEKRTKVEMLTSMGSITIELYNETPLHRDNFIKLVKEGYYNDLLFHRVIADFMIQGGDPDSKNAPEGKMLGEGGPGYTIEAEFRFPQLFHKRGVLAAAREGDDTNPEKRSSGSQFYIVWGQTFSRSDLEKITQRVEQHSAGAIVFPDEVKKYYMKYGGTPHLDGSYTVFGEVTKGIEVVNAIQQVDTDNNDRPIEDVRILNVVIK